jgi:predicted ester cyclase
MSAEQNKAIGSLFFAEQDRLHGGPAEALCAPNYTAYLGGNPPTDLAGHQHFANLFYAGFPDMYHTVDDVIVEGDEVAVRFTLRGAHTGNFMGIPATGKPVTVSAIANLRLTAGKVTELRGIFDQVGLMQQLGVMPA